MLNLQTDILILIYFSNTRDSLQKIVPMHTILKILHFYKSNGEEEGVLVKLLQGVL